MESIISTHPLETIINELVNSEFQYDILTKKSADRTKRKLSHYIALREEMIVRHKWEMENINVIIEKYRKPLEVREKALEKKFARIEEIKKRLEERSKAIASLGSLPPPAEIVPDSDSDGEREATELGNIETSLGTHSCNVYSMPK